MDVSKLAKRPDADNHCALFSINVYRGKLCVPNKLLLDEILS